jgi:hypothetical protein
VVNVTFNASNLFGPSSAGTTVTVQAPSASTPSITGFTADTGSVTIGAGTSVTLTVNASGTPGDSLSAVFTQTGGTSVGLPATPVALAGGTATVTFSTSSLTAPTNLTFAVVVTDTTAALSSAPATTSVAVVQPSGTAGQTMTLTPVEYRTGNQRLQISATATGAAGFAANAVLRLMPYTTTTGTIFDPATLGTNTFTISGGLGLLTLVGVPPPACNPGGAYATPCSATPIVVQQYDPANPTSVIGTSVPAGQTGTALTRIRQ